MRKESFYILVYFAAFFLQPSFSASSRRGKNQKVLGSQKRGEAYLGIGVPARSASWAAAIVS